MTQLNLVMILAPSTYQRRSRKVSFATKLTVVGRPRRLGRAPPRPWGFRLQLEREVPDCGHHEQEDVMKGPL